MGYSGDVKDLVSTMRASGITSIKFDADGGVRCIVLGEVPPPESISSIDDSPTTSEAEQDKRAKADLEALLYGAA